MAKKPLILFLGNKIMGDDRLGLELGTRLTKKLKEIGCDVEMLETTGLPLIDYLSGRPLAIIVDTIVTGSFSPGSVVTFTPEEFRVAKRLSPHYAGIPEALELMRALNLAPPNRVYIIGIEVLNPFEPSLELSKEIESKLDEIEKDVLGKIRSIISSRSA